MQFTCTAQCPGVYPKLTYVLTRNKLFFRFFFAEVMKYLYLTFEDPSVVSLDQFVFNTESHPMLVQCGIGDIDNY